MSVPWASWWLSWAALKQAKGETVIDQLAQELSFEDDSDGKYNNGQSIHRGVANSPLVLPLSICSRLCGFVNGKPNACPEEHTRDELATPRHPFEIQQNTARPSSRHQQHPWIKWKRHTTRNSKTTQLGFKLSQMRREKTEWKYMNQRETVETDGWIPEWSSD